MSTVLGFYFTSWKRPSNESSLLDATQWLQAGMFKHVAGMQTGDGYGVTLGYAQRF